MSGRLTRSPLLRHCSLPPRHRLPLGYRRLASRSGRDLSLAISNAESANELLDLHRRHAGALRNGIHLGNLWNKLGRKCDEIHRNHSFLAARHDELRGLLAQTTSVCDEGGCDARGLANIVHGAVRSGLLTFELGRDVHAVCDAVGRSLPPLVAPQFHPQMTSNACWAFATARHPSPVLFEAVAAALRDEPSRLEEMPPQALASLAWAYARLGHADEPLFEALAAAATPRLSSFSPQQLSNTVWAFATLDVAAPALFDAVADAATAPAAGVERWPTQAILNVAWAFLTTAHRADALHDALAAAARRRLDSCGAADTAFLLSAFATSGHRPEPALFDAAAPRVIAACERQSYSPVQLAALTAAFASARRATAPLVEALAAAAVRDAASFRLDELVTMAWGLALSADDDDAAAGESSGAAASSASVEEAAARGAKRLLRAASSSPRAVLKRHASDDGGGGGEHEPTAQQLVRLWQVQLWLRDELKWPTTPLPAGLVYLGRAALADAPPAAFAGAAALRRHGGGGGVGGGGGGGGVASSERERLEASHRRQSLARASFALHTLHEAHTAELRLDEGYTIDLALEGRRGRGKIAVLVAGPSQFDALAADDGTHQPAPAVRLGWRQLRALGWTVVPLPFWEWDRLADSTARRDYVERRLSEAAAVAVEEPAIQ